MQGLVLSALPEPLHARRILGELEGTRLTPALAKTGR